MFQLKDVEAKLRELKFGYRAKFIYKAAVFIKENHKDETWLYSLRNQPYEEVHHSLTRIPGKVYFLKFRKYLNSFFLANLWSKNNFEIKIELKCSKTVHFIYWNESINIRKENQF